MCVKMYVKNLLQAWEIIEEMGLADADEFQEALNRRVEELFDEIFGSDGWHIEYVPTALFDDDIVIEE